MLCVIIMKPLFLRSERRSLVFVLALLSSGAVLPACAPGGSSVAKSKGEAEQPNRASVASTSLAAKSESPLLEQNYSAWGEFLKLDGDGVSPAGPAPCDAACGKLRADFRYAVYVGQKIYAYWDEKRAETGTDFEALARTLEQSITSETSYTDFYLLLRRWAAAFHDGHVNSMGKDEETELEVYTAPIRLETLAPATDHEKVIIAQLKPSPDLSLDIGLKVGDEVLAINEVPIQEALDEAEKSSSGSTRRMRRFFGARRLVDVMSRGQGSATLTLTVRSPGKPDTRDETLYRMAELSPKALEHATAEPEASGIKNFKAMVLPGGIGYLRIDAFTGSQSSFLLAQAMERLSGTKGLMLDLRKNGGGDQSGNAILARLASAAITRYRTSERMSEFLMSARPTAFLVPWNQSDAFATWHDLQISPIADPGARYANKPVMAITSANCFSACDTFASALKANRLATIVGEGTGGGTGSPLVFTLPNTELSFRYSVVRGRSALGEPIEGVGTSPDIVIEPTQEERAKGKDQQLITALALLQKQITDRSAPVGPAPAPRGAVPAEAGGRLGAAGFSASAMDAALASVVRELGPVWGQELDLSPSRSELRALRRLAPVDER
jgi:C-terminal processing protease CtpA/Prc